MPKIDGGYIVLARKILENCSWQALSEAGKVTMVTLLMLANHKDKKWYNPLLKKEVMIKRGQCVIGRKTLAKKCRVGEQSVRTALTLLKSTSFLTIETTNLFSIITICNYEFYQNPKNYTNQVSNQEPNQRLTKSQPSPNQVLTTNNNIKNDNNIKNVKEIDISKDILEPLSNGCLPVVEQEGMGMEKGMEKIKSKGKDKYKEINVNSIWYQELKTDFPNIDLNIELKKMYIWLKDNPRKNLKKTFRNWLLNCKPSKIIGGQNDASQYRGIETEIKV